MIHPETQMVRVIFTPCKSVEREREEKYNNQNQNIHPLHILSSPITHTHTHTQRGKVWSFTEPGTTWELRFPAHGLILHIVKSVTRVLLDLSGYSRLSLLAPCPTGIVETVRARPETPLGIHALTEACP